MVPAEQEVLVAQCDKYQVIVKFHFPDVVNFLIVVNLLLRGKIYIRICICVWSFISERKVAAVGNTGKYVQCLKFAENVPLVRGAN